MAKTCTGEIWIETTENICDGTTSFHIGTDWFNSSGFSKNQRQKVFEALKKTMNELYPNAAINPWKDDEPGTPDFK